MIKPGIYTNTELSSEAYHGDKNSISRSALMEFKKSARKYWARHLNPDRPPAETKPSWTFGTAFHTMVLEPHLFDETYISKPEPMLLKDVGREMFDEYKERIKEIEASSKIVLTGGIANVMFSMKMSLLDNPKAKELINGGVNESSFFWEDEHSGLLLKSRPDILHSNMYVDLKTIDDASPQNFQREMVKYGYHIQAAMVKDAVFAHTGEKLSACINICVEKTYPYSIGIYVIDEEAIKTGQHEYKNLCLDLKSCIISNEWNDYPITTIGLPSWAT